MGFNAHERNLVALCCLGHAVCHLGLLVFPGALLSIKEEFGLSPFAVTALPLMGYVLLGLGALPAGLVIDKWGARRLLAVYFSALGFWALLTACSRSPALLVVGLTGLGASASLYHPAGLTLISHEVLLRGRAMGIHGIVGSLGVALGPVVGLAAGGLGSWRLAYVVVALAAGGGALWALTYARRTAASCRPKHTRADGVGPLRRFLPLLYLAMICGGLTYRALITVLPAFLVGESPQGALEKGAAGTFSVLIVGGLGQLIGGRLSDSISPARLYALLVAAAVPFAVLLGLGLGPSVPLAALLAFFLFSVQPVENNLLAQATPPERRATLYGLKFAPAFGIGAFGTALAGAIWEFTGGLQGVFFCVAALLSLMAFFVGIANRAARRAEASGPE